LAALVLLFEGSYIDDATAVAVAIAGTSDSALVGVGGVIVIAVVDGRTAGQQGVCLGGAAIVRQGGELRVDGIGGRAHLVALVAVGEAGAAGAVADEVVAGAGEGAGDVGADAIEIWKVPLVTDVKGDKFPKNDKAWDAMILEIKKHWKDKGWDLSRAYAYLSDEPPKESAQKLNQYAQRIKATGEPNLRRQIAVYTILGNSWDAQKPIFDLWKDNLDMWMVAGDYYCVPMMATLPKDTLRGMYQGAEPFQGNRQLGHSLLLARDPLFRSAAPVREGRRPGR
jgi:hypothetical protein